MENSTSPAEQKYAALVAAAATSVIGLDFDGTLAPLVDDPDAARIHPEARQVLIDLAGVVAGVAVITGRPADQALELGGLAEIGDVVAASGRELFLFGQYGNERWTSSRREVERPEPPAGLIGFGQELPDLLRGADAAEAFVEQKGLAVAVHTRRLPDSRAAYDRVLPLIRELAQRHDLSVEPGKEVVEVRGAGMHKGDAVRRLVEEQKASGFLFAGDDLGDIEALEALRELEAEGLTTLRICADTSVSSPLLPLVDLVVDGVDGVLALLRRFVADVAQDTSNM